jgi:hypothetical protein
MTGVKSPAQASRVTLQYKWKRYERIKVLFGVRRLGDLFPLNSTPNDAGDDPLSCSGDVLRDLGQIGEVLKKKGYGTEERKQKLKKEFQEGVIVSHKEIRGLLAKFRKNEFEERLKEMMRGNGRREVAQEQDEILPKIETTPTRSIIKKETKDLGNESTKKTRFVTADQIRADLRRRREIRLWEIRLLERKRTPEIQERTPEILKIETESDLDELEFDHTSKASLNLYTDLVQSVETEFYETEFDILKRRLYFYS